MDENWVKDTKNSCCAHTKKERTKNMNYNAIFKDRVQHRKTINHTEIVNSFSTTSIKNRTMDNASQRKKSY
jgi:hypothetical protein